MPISTGPRLKIFLGFHFYKYNPDIWILIFYNRDKKPVQKFQKIPNTACILACSNSICQLNKITEHFGPIYEILRFGFPRV